MPGAVNDKARLAALASYNILDTVPEPEFDDLVQIAGEVCRTPIALVSLVASERQWFKATKGLDACETPIEQSVCAHGLSRPDLLIIPDLTGDPRTAGNPLVTGEPFLRFYAGAPLITPGGDIIGMLCVIDTVPRPAGLSAGQQESLAALSRQVIGQMEMRKLVADLGLDLFEGRIELSGALEQANLDSFEIARLKLTGSRLRAAQEAGRIGTFEVDIAANRLLVTPEFCRIFGIPPRTSFAAEELEALVFPEDRHLASTPETRSDGSASGLVEYRIVRPDDGQLRWITRRAELMAEAGRPVRMLGTVQDTTAQHLLNGEIAHRLKNTLAVVHAIAATTLRGVTEQALVETFVERLGSLATAHDLLLRNNSETGSLAAMIEAVASRLGQGKRFTLTGPPVVLGSQAAMSVTMLAHELATNAIKHGALSAPDGRIEVEWTADDETVRLTWTETGGPPAHAPARQGFGSRLIARGLVGLGDAEMRYADSGFSIAMSAALSRLAI